MSEVLDIYAGAPKGEELLKAFNSDTLKNVKMNEPKSSILDPYSANGEGGTRQKPTSISYNTLRRMAQVPAISAIVNTRLNQVARFARRPRFEGDMGFKVMLKDSEAKMNPKQKKMAFEIEEFFLKTGAIPNAKRKDNMDSFLRKIVRDTLTLDVMCWENVPNIKGGLAELWAVDGATIELVAGNPMGEGAVLPVYEPITKRGQTDAGAISYVQKINGQTTAEYTEDELTFAIRNPRTDVMLVDFGMSEMETLIEIITGIMNGVRYNTSYFNSSSLPQGVLEIVGKYKDEHLEAFKRHWKTLTSGASGKWAVPVMGLQEGQGFKFTPFKTSNRDMEFNQFLEFLFNVACAVYQIDPNEVGFKSWTSNTGMSQSDNTEVKIDSSKDKGFIPLMQFVANTFNAQVIDRMNSDYALVWVGIDEQDEAQKQERDQKNVDMGKITIAELRKRDDMEEILGDDGKPAPWTLAPANPQLIQVFMSVMTAQQQQEQAQQQQAMQQQQGAMDGAQKQIDAETQHKQGLEMADKQHQQGLEAKNVDNKNALAMADQAHAHGLESQGLDQKHALAMADKTHGQGLESQTIDNKNALAMADKTHGQGLETQSIEQKHADKTLYTTHKQGLESQELEHKHADKTLDKTNDNQVKAGDTQHDRSFKTMDKQHAQAKDMANFQHDQASKDGDVAHKRGQADKKSDQAHQVKIETIKQKGKSASLKKSFDMDEEDPDDFEIVIDWAKY